MVLQIRIYLQSLHLLIELNALYSAQLILELKSKLFIDKKNQPRLAVSPAIYSFNFVEEKLNQGSVRRQSGMFVIS